MWNLDLMEWFLMVDHPGWASSRDPRHLADIYNERTNSLKPVSNSFNAFYHSLPEKVREKVLVNRRIQKIHQQFSQVVDPYILDHTNSVYLLRHKDPLGQSDKNGKEKNTYSGQNSTDSSSSTTVSNSGIYNADKKVLGNPDRSLSNKPPYEVQEVFDLVVYVDNSLVAAELNARRELIRLKYREQFKVVIDIFEIRISRGAYKDKYPFKELRDRDKEYRPAHTLTQEELNEIDELLKDIPEGKLRASFKKVIKAQKQNSEKK